MQVPTHTATVHMHNSSLSVFCSIGEPHACSGRMQLRECSHGPYACTRSLLCATPCSRMPVWSPCHIHPRLGHAHAQHETPRNASMPGHSSATLYTWRDRAVPRSPACDEFQTSTKSFSDEDLHLLGFQRARNGSSRTAGVQGWVVQAGYPLSTFGNLVLDS